MHHLAFLIAVGPCLIMALAALAMSVLSRTLTQTRHAQLWAISFTVYMLEWAVLGFGHADAASPLRLTTLVGLLGTVAVFCYFAGFQQRRSEARLSRLLGIGAMIFLAQSLLAAAAPGTPLATAGQLSFPLVRAILFGRAAMLVAPRHRETSATERFVIAMLVCVALSNLALIAIVLLQHAQTLPPGSSIRVALILGEPISAAMGLFTLMLIASDFSRERLRLIHTDPLTGVLNRLGFERGAARMIARARPPARPMALVLTDIDRFKAINDRFGHLTGDAALISFARHLIDGVPESALVGRFGGEEFALAVNGRDAAGAAVLAEAIRATLGRLTVPGSARVALTASFGVAELLPREALVGLYSRADGALYHSKQQGRNQTSIDPARAG